MIQLYGLLKCSTCKKARDWLSSKNIEHEFIDYRDQPLSPALLTQYAKSLGGWEKLVNRASMTWRQLSEEQREASTDKQWQDLIAQYPALVRRPLTILDDGTVMTGFSEKKFQQHQDLK
ncbi:MAG: Spx/MgsR family RNA polymerase-binding regulatory protein [Orrella sp.]